LVDWQAECMHTGSWAIGAGKYLGRVQAEAGTQVPAFTLVIFETSFAPNRKTLLAYNFLKKGYRFLIFCETMSAIEILGLEKTYSVGFWRKRPKRALLPLDLRVEDGEIFGFLGPNGAGKTTTIKMLMGLVAPTAGTARILGKEINDPEMKAQIGFLPEQPYFYDYLTARELLEYYGQLSGVSVKDRSRKVSEMLERVGLRDAAEVQLRKFSKGMLQRVGLAQSILHDPKVVFFDEPMSGLDPMGRREVRDLMEQLKREGKTVFFSTHILSDAEALCDRVAIIHLGKLRKVGAIADLTSGVQGQIEIVWLGTATPVSLKTLGADCHVLGNTVRAVLSESAQEAALDAVRREGLRLVSLTPVRVSLEDYFVAQVGPMQASAGGTS
jgi:ABC-2 type transport system ATP-binding protein